MITPHPFHTLLPQHSQSLYRRALKLTNNKHRAEDLVQATLLKAWTHRVDVAARAEPAGRAVFEAARSGHAIGLRQDQAYIFDAGYTNKSQVLLSFEGLPPLKYSASAWTPCESMMGWQPSCRAQGASSVAPLITPSQSKLDSLSPMRIAFLGTNTSHRPLPKLGQYQTWAWEIR
ncbi:RNA polymerase sigma factor [Roseovarius sp. D0-M9]|uniref:RNA polymerase sigma factor n=1 Tax=Roseovarius sp. D0-M9 TaxID=3127117 RepID=UPI003FA6CFA5